jgi:transposase
LPKLVHARKAKLMMGKINKTDKLDVRELNQVQRNGALPTVWIPPGELRDQRDLPRTRMVLVRQRTQLKNRIPATLAKYPPRSGGERPLKRAGPRPPAPTVRRTRPSNCSSMSRIWTIRSAGSNTRSRPCSSPRPRFSCS